MAQTQPPRTGQPYPYRTSHCPTGRLALCLLSVLVILIYLAAFNTPALETGQLTWNAGGGGPGGPIWLVAGADGNDYFVGTDAQSYTLAELPLK